jgi:hypothetical protein
MPPAGLDYRAADIRPGANIEAGRRDCLEPTRIRAPARLARMPVRSITVELDGWQELRRPSR